MNWVERRHECNAKHALQNLRAEARDNVETRTRQLHAERSPAGPLPKLEEDTEDGFTVTQNGDTVKFEMTDARTIRVTGNSIRVTGSSTLLSCCVKYTITDPHGVPHIRRPHQYRVSRRMPDDS